MVGGFNTNVRYSGRIFHVQTEDGGATSPRIVTLLYEGGSILPTGGQYLPGTVVALQANPDIGYRLVAWSGTDNNPAAGSNSNTVTMNANRTVTVSFSPAGG